MRAHTPLTLPRTQPAGSAAFGSATTVAVVTRDEPLTAERMHLPAPPPRRPSALRTLAEIPVLLVIAVLMAFVVKSFLAQAFYIPTGSMLPQLQLNDRVVVSKLAFKMHDPRRGDIVVFDNPTQSAVPKPEPERTGAERFVRSIGEAVGFVQPSTDEYIKRVIGLPGERVEGREGHVFINGKRLFEPYLTDSVRTNDFGPITVEPDRLWVMGDNRAGSSDSRRFGQVRQSTVVGRAVVKVWPPSSISFL